jgi:hypothetical protein
MFSPIDLEKISIGKKQYLEAINTEIKFENDIPTDINKYVEKIEKLATGIEFCWDIFSEESLQYFRKIAYGFTQASSKCKGWQGLLIKFRLILPSIQQQEDLFSKYQKSFLIIPKAVVRAIESRKSNFISGNKNVSKRKSVQQTAKTIQTRFV